MRQSHSRLSLAQQALDLRCGFPGAAITLTPVRLQWTGTIRPTPLSRAYRTRLTYRLNQVPEVLVLEPLERRPGKSLPHVYREGTLCLHKPGEWTPRMFLSDSTLAWTAEWLLNYEVWKATGDWHGGGEWPPLRQPEFDSNVRVQEERDPQLPSLSEDR